MNSLIALIALLHLSVFGFSIVVVFHDKTRSTRQGKLPLWESLDLQHGDDDDDDFVHAVILSN